MLNRIVLLVGFLSLVSLNTSFANAASVNAELSDFLGRGYTQVSYTVNGKDISQAGSYASIANVSNQVKGSKSIVDFCTTVAKRADDLAYICADSAGIYEADFYQARKSFRIVQHKESATENSWKAETTSHFSASSPRRECAVSRETTLRREGMQIFISQKATLCSGRVLQREVVLSK